MAISFNHQIRWFMRWWGAGLFSSLPESVRKWFRTEWPRLILQMRDAQCADVFWQQEGKQQFRGEWCFNSGDGVALENFLPTRMQGKKYLVDLRLGGGQVLHLQRHFPEAVKENLAQVVGYQLDRLTPFTSDLAYHDAQVISHDKARKEILADIHVIPRHVVDRLIRQVGDAGIPAVQVVSIAGVESEVNLLGREQSGQERGWSWIPFYFFLGALLISLLAPLAYKYRRVGQLDEALTELRRSSGEQLAIRDKLMAAEDALKFLEEKRRDSPVALDVVEKLSAEIPDHTWLERLTLEGRSLEIRGESGKALSLIDTLEDSPEFSDVKFKSPVTRNKENGHDRFHIEATVEAAHDAK